MTLNQICIPIGPKNGGSFLICGMSREFASFYKVADFCNHQAQNILCHKVLLITNCFLLCVISFHEKFSFSGCFHQYKSFLIYAGCLPSQDERKVMEFTYPSKSQGKVVEFRIQMTIQGSRGNFFLDQEIIENVQRFQ